MPTYKTSYSTSKSGRAIAAIRGTIAGDAKGRKDKHDAQQRQHAAYVAALKTQQKGGGR